MATENPITDEMLKSELLKLDVMLRRKQNKWEEPRTLFGIATAIFIAGAAVGAALLTGLSRPHPIVVQFGGEPLHVHLDQDKQP